MPRPITPTVPLVFFAIHCLPDAKRINMVKCRLMR